MSRDVQHHSNQRQKLKEPKTAMNGDSHKTPRWLSTVHSKLLSRVGGLSHAGIFAYMIDSDRCLYDRTRKPRQ